MHFKNLDLNLLVALDALLTECNISRAAARMHLSQSGMSNALTRLREYFGDDLLVQVGRKMLLTARAEVLKLAVHDVLLRVDATISAPPEFVPAESDREFKVLVSDYTMTTLMPRLIALARAQSTTIRFSLLPQVEEPQTALERGEADLLVIPTAFSATGHPTELLLKEDFCCVVWNGSVHAGRELTVERYAAAAHVMTMPPGRSTFETWFFERYGITRAMGVTTVSFAVAPYLVVGSDLIATVQGRIARQAQRHLPLTLLPPPVAMPTMDQAMQWHKYRALDPALIWLRGLMLEAARRLDA